MIQYQYRTSTVENKGSQDFMNLKREPQKKECEAAKKKKGSRFEIGSYPWFTFFWVHILGSHFRASLQLFS